MITTYTMPNGVFLLADFDAPVAYAVRNTAEHSAKLFPLPRAHSVDEVKAIADFVRMCKCDVTSIFAILCSNDVDCSLPMTVEVEFETKAGDLRHMRVVGVSNIKRFIETHGSNAIVRAWVN